LTLNGKIFILTAIRNSVIGWYHQYLCHPGAMRTETTIRGTIMWPGLTRNVKSFCKTCKLCQFNQKTKTQYGKIPVKMAEATPWEIVQVDLIGPWKVKTRSGVKTLTCFTAIDPDTSWPEICEITDKRSQTVMDAFQNNWLCLYPRPIQVTFDNGSEFKSVFKEMCDDLGIKCRPTTSYNPQGNSIIERIHQVLEGCYR
jgi:IS30 family transposase